jgi:UDP-N-acetylglucosamine--N-acetylmuramyl-(pentapeptide) pyrophosphoryl-undecaprenol N-acetylglucosamine transferase
VVFGGSQGALRLNRASVEAARRLAGRGDLQLLLLTGRAHHEEVRAHVPSGGRLVVRTQSFLDRMELAYAVADLTVSRAGATTVAEVATCGLPAVLVPYPYATGRHQEANARALQRAGGASVILDDELDGATLAERIEALVDHRERLEAMARAAATFARPAAADDLADLVAEVAKQR